MIRFLSYVSPTCLQYLQLSLHTGQWASTASEYTSSCNSDCYRHTSGVCILTFVAILSAPRMFPSTEMTNPSTDKTQHRFPEIIESCWRSTAQPTAWRITICHSLLYPDKEICKPSTPDAKCLKMIASNTDEVASFQCALSEDTTCMPSDVIQCSKSFMTTNLVYLWYKFVVSLGELVIFLLGSFWQLHQ